MTWQADGVKKVTRRTFLMGGAQVALASILFGRMFYLQVVEADKYKMLADKNRIGLKLIAPPRGLILDCNDIPLAYNRKTFRSVIVAEDTNGNLRSTLMNFGKLVPVSDEEYERILKEIKQKRAFMSVRVKDDLSFDEMASIQLNIPDLPGISIEDSLMRVYPSGEKSAHAIGYVSFMTDEDLKNQEDLQKMPDVRIGRTGVEEFYEDRLYGQTGSRKIEINAVGREVRELEKQDAVPGENLRLFLDSRLQEVGYNALKEEAGSAVLIDIETGGVKMLVSTPSYDPNLFNAPLDVKTWKNLSQNERRPLMNKAIAGQYSPGSVFKIVVALAALENGIINEHTRIQCDGRLFVGDHPFHCWKKTGHGPLNLVEALQHSCDIFFYQIAYDTGVDKIVEMASRLGFGDVTGIDLVGEKAGLLPSRAWKEAKYGDAWRRGDTMNMGIGQGFLLATPLQMAVMMARVSSKGKKIMPRLLQSDVTETAESLNISPQHLALVLKGLRAVVNERGGTAYHTRINVNGQRMGGKTASTQIRRITLKEREEGLKQQHELKWKDRDHAFFVGYAPTDKPKYALAVAVEHGGGGGSKAAPIAGEIMRKVLELEQIDKETQKDDK